MGPDFFLQNPCHAICLWRYNLNWYMDLDFLSSKPMAYHCLSVCSWHYSHINCISPPVHLSDPLEPRAQPFTLRGLSTQSLHTSEPTFFFHPFAITINQIPGGPKQITCLMCVFPVLLPAQGQQVPHLNKNINK